MCDDEPGTCGHSLCSCDKNLAEELAINEDKWNLHHHHKWGEFDRDQCLIKEEKKQVNMATLKIQENLFENIIKMVD